MKEDNYKKYRGKCKEFVDEAIKKNPSLKAVRGYYHDPLWGKEAHWWCKREDGTIYDPTALQFPSKGHGKYEEFNEILNCEQCGKEIEEDKAIIMGNGHYAVCSQKCACNLVGLGEFYKGGYND